MPKVDNPWQDQWKELLHHIDEMRGKGEEGGAILYIFTSFFTFLGNYYEGGVLGGQTKVEKVLTHLQELRNRVEEDYDAQKIAPDPQGAQDALNAYNGYTDDEGQQHIGIKGIFKKYKRFFDASYIKSALEEFENKSSPNGTIFVGNKSFEGLASSWHSVWTNEKQDGGTSASLSSVTNAMSAFRNDITQEGSTVQSKINYYIQQDKTFKATTHSGQSDYINLIKTMNSNMGKA